MEEDDCLEGLLPDNFCPAMDEETKAFRAPKDQPSIDDLHTILAEIGRRIESAWGEALEALAQVQHNVEQLRREWLAQEAVDDFDERVRAAHKRFVAAGGDRLDIEGCVRWSMERKELYGEDEEQEMAMRTYARAFGLALALDPCFRLREDGRIERIERD